MRREDDRLARAMQATKNLVLAAHLPRMAAGRIRWTNFGAPPPRLDTIAPTNYRATA